VPDLRSERLAAARRALGARGLDGLIVRHLANVRYLTGFSGSSAALAILPSEAVLLTDFRYRTQAETEAGAVARVEIAATDLWERVWSVLTEYAGVGTIGYEPHAVTGEEVARFGEQAPTRLRVVPTGPLVEDLRVRKDPTEVQAIRGAAQLCTEALAATLPRVRVGRTEREVAALLEHELRVRGSEWHPFPSIVASGPRTALPHAGVSARPIERGDLLLLDFGARVGGYCADVTRTVVVGARADERQLAAYQLVRDAQAAARHDLRAGMTGRDADRLARSLIESRGFGDAFGHSLGHGLGLEVHEAPRVSRTNDQPLPVDAVVTVEPGVYVPGWGGIRIEDDVRLTRDGCELLSDGRTELVELT
jgi:Xaa-Pro aminopeptidase